ncbi:MFS transporter [Kosakonia sp. S42]|uniref:MFS transporter n=1 Tax=Kosakonia sp. S42 TaxID=2767458 RepID=UPI00190C000B|nr:MFS transporter [Kosakonia sp. S42]MBK0018749.1 MFS transporter [Kosakonia sp. S42]
MRRDFDAGRKWWIMTGVGILSFLGCIDFTIVNTALPAMRAALHASVNELQWFINAFLLALSACMVVMGRIADLYGRRRVLYAGAVGFGMASLAAGLVSQAEWLIAFRGIQGVCCAVLYTASGAIISHAFPEDQRGKAIGWLFGINGLGLAVGPVLGGIVVSTLGWRWIFLLNVPLIAVSLIICAMSVKESRDDTALRTLDWRGLILLITALSCGLWAVTQGNEYGWLSLKIMTAGCFSLLMLAFFYRTERRVESPILDFSLFLRRSFIGAVLAQAALAFFYVLGFFLMPLYLSEVVGMAGYQVGLMLLPTTATVAILSPIVGRITDQYGYKSMLLGGFALFAASAALQASFSASSSISIITVAFLLMGAGWACILGPSTVAALSSVPENKGAVAMGSCWTIHNIGGAIGLASGIFCYQLAAGHQLACDVANLGVEPGSWIRVAVSDLEGGLNVMQHHIPDLNLTGAHALLRQAFLMGYRVAMGLLAGVSVMTFVALLLITHRFSNSGR